MTMHLITLDGLNRDELTDLLERVMIRLRHVEAEEIKTHYVSKSQRLRLEQSVQKHLQQSHQHLAL